jgi:hypothetical protein
MKNPMIFGVHPNRSNRASSILLANRQTYQRQTYRVAREIVAASTGDKSAITPL